MPLKERLQNPTCNDTIRLRLFSYNSNNRANLQDIQKVDIYTLDPNEISQANPDGRRLVATIDGADVISESAGSYYIDISADSPLYSIGD